MASCVHHDWPYSISMPPAASGGEAIGCAFLGSFNSRQLLPFDRGLFAHRLLADYSHASCGLISFISSSGYLLDPRRVYAYRSRRQRADLQARLLV